MIDIIQISDTHFGTEVPAVIEALKARIAENKPDAILLTGDITQRARENQFKAATDFFASLPAPQKMAIPGNHDIPLYNIYARFISPYHHYEKAFGERTVHMQGRGVYYLGFDATGPWRHTRGHLKTKAVEAALQKARFAMQEGDILVVAAHQPLAVAKTTDENNILIHAETTAQLFAKYKVDIVLSGHVHYPLIERASRYYPSLPYDFILSGAGTAVSHRIRPGAPNSFNRIEITDGQIAVERYDYDSNTHRFIMHTRKLFHRYANGWQSDTDVVEQNQ